jgi:hypothetical protein
MTRCTGREQPSIRLLVGSSRSKGAHVIARSSRMRQAVSRAHRLLASRRQVDRWRMGVRTARRSLTRRRRWIDAGGEKGGGERGVSLQLLHRGPESSSRRVPAPAREGEGVGTHRERSRGSPASIT